MLRGSRAVVLHLASVISRTSAQFLVEIRVRVIAQLAFAADTGERMSNQSQTQRLGALREQIARGEYDVDPVAVADAVVRRLREQGLLGERQVTQSECSKPASGPVASVKRAVAGPLTARPIQVIRTASFVLANFASISLRPAGGAQTQSS